MGDSTIRELLELKPPALAVWLMVIIVGVIGTAAPRLSLEHSETRPAWRLNVNTATQEELEVLPSIGPRRARMIVESRQKRGAFGSVSDLVKIRGFSAALVQRLEPLLKAEASSGQSTKEVHPRG